MRLRAAALAVCLAATVCAGKEIQMDEPPPKDAAKEAVEEWFSKQVDHPSSVFPSSPQE